jgi:hypothetical protein
MAIRVPEGFVFVKRAPGVALALLEAADKIKADRQAGIRTVSGGYHVAEDIAAEYETTRVESGEDAADEANADAAASTAATTGDAATGDAGDTGAQAATTQEAGEPKDDDPKTATPRDGWSHAQFDEWAENQDPKVEFPSGANLKQKLEIATKPAAG